MTSARAATARWWASTRFSIPVPAGSLITLLQVRFCGLLPVLRRLRLHTTSIRAWLSGADSKRRTSVRKDSTGLFGSLGNPARSAAKALLQLAGQCVVEFI